jgi:hypothetical protein
MRDRRERETGATGVESCEVDRATTEFTSAILRFAQDHKIRECA